MKSKARAKKRKTERESEEVLLEKSLGEWASSQLKNVAKEAVIWARGGVSAQKKYQDFYAKNPDVSKDLYNRLNSVMMWWEFIPHLLIEEELGIQDNWEAYRQCREFWEALGAINIAHVNELALWRRNDTLKRGDARDFYLGYLKSPHWARTREIALQRTGNKCQVCNTTNSLQVHHNTYQRLTFELPTDLIVLCADCHQIFHTNGKLKDIE